MYLLVYSCRIFVSLPPPLSLSRLAAERAQRQRRAAKGIYRRQEYRDSLDEVIKEESVALRKKNKLLPASALVPFPEHHA
jgi:hypothetical protein